MQYAIIAVVLLLLWIIKHLLSDNKEMQEFNNHLCKVNDRLSRRLKDGGVDVSRDYNY